MAKSLSDLRKMQRNQLTRLTKEDLIESIMAPPEPSEGLLQALTSKLNDLVKEVGDLRSAVTAPDSGINKRFDDLQSQVNKQAQIIASQQRYLEILDRKERESNLILTGVPDENEALEGGTSDEVKLKKVWSKVGITEEIKEHRRLGKRDDNNRRRPILVTVASRQGRDKILEKAKRLKEAEGEYRRIYIKKDLHPSVRGEWRRLRQAEQTEQQRPENVGCTVRLDIRERKLYKDGIVIDAWNPPFF